MTQKNLLNLDKSIDTPISELTLRRYEKPVGLKGRELLRRVCLSLGILQPGDSRDIIIDIFSVLIDSSKNQKWLSSEEIRDLVVSKRSSESLDMKGLAPSNVRRQLKRLRDIQLVEKVKNLYRITEFLSLKEIFEERIQNLLLSSIVARVSDYIDLYEENSS
ncbi:hypothetical protein JXM83_03825 [Candidatus Woesearchaeota archaeon]|nr:hypothetical protein [Candidatus Woesearchaeota archaeon]